jgi:Asp-tRNA(Asn)/Glu-tRNA(Gln) amidotransferase A subunit family amidase
MTSSITDQVLSHALSLIGHQFSAEQRALMLADLSLMCKRIEAARSSEMDNSLGPATRFDPRPNGFPEPQVWQPDGWQSRTGIATAPATKPAGDDLAFASVLELSEMLERRVVSSVELTEAYLARIEQYDEQLHAVVTVTAERAFEMARRADRCLAKAERRSKLQGVPFGVKDIFDTAGDPTTWGAEPFADRIGPADATIVERLAEQGAPLLAKTAVGALAYGDVWLGRQTRNPWNLAEGSSGSSAGSAASVAAGLVGFAIGTETMGSIVSPCMRCGVAGLRPTFGRVPRTGAMALCWSLDKVGPIARSVADLGLVLGAIHGPDGTDRDCTDYAFEDRSFGSGTSSGAADDALKPLDGVTLGYDPSWFQADRGSDPLDRVALETLADLGARLRPVELPDLDYDSLWLILHAEAAAAFQQLTLSGADQSLTRQDGDAWPNLFRKAALIPAVDMIQAQRLRAVCIERLAETMGGIQALVGPTFAPGVQLLTNMTGHPALVVPVGFARKPTRLAITAIGDKPTPTHGTETTHLVPHGITLWGGLYQERVLLDIGYALERALGNARLRPEVFTA